jgi:hypothetical protein
MKMSSEEQRVKTYNGLTIFIAVFTAMSCVEKYYEGLMTWHWAVSQIIFSGLFMFGIYLWLD